MRPARLFLSLLVAASAPPAVRAESFQFQADVNKLMVRSRSPPRPAARNSRSPPTAPSCSATQDIIINSLYSKKEIFLRELISNGSDVCSPSPPTPPALLLPTSTARLRREGCSVGGLAMNGTYARNLSIHIVYNSRPLEYSDYEDLRTAIKA